MTRYKSTCSVTSRNGFKIIDLLGKGTYKFLKCENLSDGKFVAIKMTEAAEECMTPKFYGMGYYKELQSIAIKCYDTTRKTTNLLNL